MSEDYFSEFQLKEYENISQAHFKTNESISAFYRYFLIVMAIPTTIISIALVKPLPTEIATTLIGSGQLIFALFIILLGLFGIGLLINIEGLRQTK